MKYPNFLKQDDEIRIVSPSSAIDSQYIDGAKATLEKWGYKVTEGMFTRKTYGRFAGTDQERFTDIQQALDDPNVKAILCSRGGYGMSRIVDKLNFDHFKKNPKWIIGFSDITILHQAVNRKTDYISIHASMAKNISLLSENSSSTILSEVLKGKMPQYNVESNPNNRIGTAKGMLVGGNLTVAMSLRDTPFDIDYTDSILFIEDTGEAPYKIDRMMQSLRLSGALAKISGLIVGQFTDTEEDKDINATIYELITDAVKDYDYPVCFGFLTGHIDDNMPLMVGSNCSLKVTDSQAKLSFQTTFWKKAKNVFTNN